MSDLYDALRRVEPFGKGLVSADGAIYVTTPAANLKIASRPVEEDSRVRVELPRGGGNLRHPNWVSHGVTIDDPADVGCAVLVGGSACANDVVALIVNLWGSRIHATAKRKPVLSELLQDLRDALSLSSPTASASDIVNTVHELRMYAKALESKLDDIETALNVADVGLKDCDIRVRIGAVLERAGR